MKKTLTLIVSVLLVVGGLYAQEKPVALVGATIVGLGNYGNNNIDIPNSVVILQKGKIAAVGKNGSLRIPKGAKVVNVSGKFIVPGLIDCFSVIGTQGQANSHLYYGVTTVVAGPGDENRKGYFPNGNPSPHIKEITTIPPDSLDDALEKKGALTPDDIANVNRQIDQIGSLKKSGIRTILLLHMFPEELIPKMVAQCYKYGINTIGEMQYAHYSAGLKAGVNSFVHTSRYILGAFPDSLFLAVRNEFDTAANRKFARYFNHLNAATDPTFNSFAQAVAASRTALMPTLAMLYTSLPDHKNIWNEPGAYLTDPKDVFLPMDTATGKSTSFISAKNANRQVGVEKAFIKAGVHYITGSGADAFGTLPGISEQIEIQLLHRYGLTNRQSLAAATGNPSIFNHWPNIGLIEAGRDADLLVLSANPVDDLENLKKIDQLYVAGKLIDRQALLTPLKKQ